MVIGETIENEEKEHSVLLTFEILNFRRDFWHTVIASEAKQSRRDAKIASSLRSSQ
jgi:hypothetical protein